MKKIKIFLGSSITEFEKERNDLELFIRNVSDEFEEKYNIKLVPLRCENLDNYVRNDGTQSAINEDLVLGSDMCFFIFFTKAGEFTEEEFRIAFEKFKKDGKPKIYIYFKNIPDGQAVEESVYNFMSKIDNELKHYHGSFDHIDTIKLRILLNLKLQEMDFVSVELSNGKCVVNGKETMDLTNVSEFANNSILQQLQKELAETEKQYLQMRPIYAKGNATDTFYKEYAKIISERENLTETIEELQTNIFNMSLRICTDEVHGDITLRQKEAYRLFELGDYEGAITVLDSADIDSDFFEFEKQQEEKLREKAKIFIKEHKTAIDILMTMIKYQNRFNEIEERYEKIIKIAEKYSICFDVILDYSLFQFKCKDIEKGIKIAEKLENMYNYTPGIISTEDKLNLYYWLASMYSMYAPKKHLSEKYYTYVIDTITNSKVDINNQSSDLFSGLIADSYVNLCRLYWVSNNSTKVLEYFNKALNYVKKLCEADNSYNVILTYILSLGCNYYCNFECDLKKAEYYFNKTIKLLNEFNYNIKTCSKEIKGCLATIYLYISDFFELNNKDNTEMLLLSLNAYENLAAEYPLIGSLPYVTLCVLLADKYTKNKEFEKASQYIRSCENTLNFLQEQNNSLCYECGEIYALLVGCYNEIGDQSNQELACKKALKCFRNLDELQKSFSSENYLFLFEELLENFETNHDENMLDGLIEPLFSIDLNNNPMLIAERYKVIADIYSMYKIKNKAKAYYKKSNKINAIHNKTDFILNSSQYYESLGNIYECEDNYYKSKRCYERSLKILQSAPKHNVAVPTTVMLKAYYNLADFYRLNNKDSKALFLYESAISIASESPLDNDENLLILANCYYGKGCVIDKKENEHTIFLFKKADEIYQSLKEVEFNEYYPQYIETLHKLSIYYLKGNNINKGVIYLEKMLPLLDYAFGEDKDEYFKDIVGAYNLYAILSEEEKDIDEIIPIYLRIIDICENDKKLLTDKELEIISKVYKKLSLYYFDNDGIKEAKKYSILHIDALKIYLKKHKSEELLYELANSYQFLAEISFIDESTIELENYCISAIELLEELSRGNAVKYSSDLAYSYMVYGKSTSNNEYIKKAYITAKLNTSDLLCSSVIDDIKESYPNLLSDESN